MKKLTVGSPQLFLNYLEINPNTTRYSVLWCTSEWQVSEKINASVPCTYSDPNKDMIFYTIWTNKSLTPDYLFKPILMPVPNESGLL